MILKETILSAFNERGTLLKWLKKVEKLITEKVLVKPVNNPQSTEIVAVDNTGAQVMLGVGAGLTIENGVLKFADVYDGTVIIEKANSVLGLRRFKETITPMSVSIDYSSLDYMSITYNKYLIGITPIEMEGIIVNGFTPLLEVVNQNNETNIIFIISITQNGETGIYALPESNVRSVIEEFEVLSTANTTVNEWLLANTEGVSV